jgi:hypothetical protein
VKTNTYLFVILILLCYQGVNAQLQVGLQGGSTLSKVSFRYLEDYRLQAINYTQGFAGGIVIKYDNTGHAGLQLEFNLTQKGWSEAQGNSNNDTTKYKRTIQYLEMPFLSSFNIGGGKLRAIINIGPYGAYALSSKETLTYIDSGLKESGDYEFDEDLDNRIDFGLIAGAGVEYRFPKSTLMAEARMNMGIANILKIRTLEAETSHNQSLYVLIRYVYVFGKRFSKSE